MFKAYDFTTKTLRVKRSFLLKNFSTSKANQQRKVAVVLSGCGVLDGTEVHEASAVAVHLHRMGMEIQFYAPTVCQKDVMDHSKGCPVTETRHVLIEAARIARGEISPLCNLKACSTDALVFPGGFGAAKTLSTFAKDGAGCALNEEVMRIMQEFQAARKPMGFICISAILAAKMFPCVKITLGKKGDPELWPHSDAIDVAREMGATIEEQDVTCFSYDNPNLVFSTPAFMYKGSYNEVYDGIGNMLKSLKKAMC